MKNKAIIFDLSGTLVKMRPPTLLVKRSKLKDLKTKYKLAILTGAKRKETGNILRKLKIEKFFSLVITKDDSSFKKPDKKLFFLIKKYMRFKKALYIGDTIKDYKFARNCKIDFLFVGKKTLGIKQDKNINNLVEYILCKRGR
ncbi:MAG: HAD family hydrolase [Patescibacteria group bacterium]